MKGSIVRRGKKSWRIIFDVGRDPATGKRLRHYHTVRGTRQEAEQKRADLLSARGKGEYVAPSRLTVAEHVRARVDHWEAAGEVSAKTAERYRQLIDGQIAPQLGSVQVQKLTPLDVEKWHARLRKEGRKDGAGGVSARTIGHAHRVLGKALKEGLRHALVARNVASLQSAPRVGGGDAENGKEMKILTADQQRAVLAGLAGKPLYSLVVTALYTGLRRGEMLALRWRNVDLNGKVLRIRESLESTKAGGVRFKMPKTRAGRRDVTLPDIVIEALRAHLRQRLEQRVVIEQGVTVEGGVIAFPKLPDDALVFATFEGEPLSLNAVSKAWALAADGFGVGDVTLHGLRHTHASQLIDSGKVDIVTISKRLGHASPAITMKVYAHLFQQSDAKAADAINAALAGLGQA